MATESGLGSRSLQLLLRALYCCIDTRSRFCPCLSDTDDGLLRVCSDVGVRKFPVGHPKLPKLLASFRQNARQSMHASVFRLSESSKI